MIASMPKILSNEFSLIQNAWIAIEISLMFVTKDPINSNPGGCLNIKMSSNQYRDPHVKDKTVSRSSYL